jgi:signal peptidase I
MAASFIRPDYRNAPFQDMTPPGAADSETLPLSGGPVVWLRRIAFVLLALLLLAGAAALATLRFVQGDDMRWSIQDGDAVWILPGRVRRADVGLLRDPLDPSRTVLRRAVAGEGKKVRIDSGGIRVNGKRIRQQEMGEDGAYRVLKEVIWSKPPARANAYLPEIRNQPGSWTLDDPVEVPDGHWWVMADNRDVALDSRWWGPVSEDDILGVVRFRVSPRDPWREPWALLLPEE